MTWRSVHRAQIQVKVVNHTRAPEPQLAAVLALASAASSALLFPYVLALMPRLRSAPAPLSAVLLGQTAQSGLLARALAWLGLTLGADLVLHVAAPSLVR